MMIGGEHYFKALQACANSLGDLIFTKIGEVSLFASGRDALFSLLETLPENTIYLPDLICLSVYAACLAAGKQVRTYKVGPDLFHREFPNVADNRGGCIYVMHYFGATNHRLLTWAREGGIKVISDITHLLFNERVLTIAQNSSYMTGSLRKSGPFPDGGFISSRFHPVVAPNLPIRSDFHSLRVAGLLSRGFSASEGFPDDENFLMLRRAEEMLDQARPGAYQCSYLAKRLLHTVDLDGTAAQVKKNISVLSFALNGLCETVNAPDAASIYFFCLFRNGEERNAVRSRLAGQRIFCPIHWDTSHMPEPSPLSELCLSIPCDARYSEADMHLIADIIRSCLKN